MAAPVETPVAALPSDTGIQASLIEVVVKHTGYPADFIEMDQDLEGELGIDTVKQAEIMVDVRERFALPVDEDFLLSDHPTLNHFVAYIVRMKGGGQTAEPSPIVETAVESQSVKSPLPIEHDGCRRWQVEVEQAESVPSKLTLEGTIAVTDDGWGIAEHICSRLGERTLHGSNWIRSRNSRRIDSIRTWPNRSSWRPQIQNTSNPSQPHYLQ